MDPQAREFVEQTNSAAMVTLRRDGTPHVVRVGIAVVGGRIWSSGTADRVRTGHLRRDPRATLFVWNSRDPAKAYNYLGLEATVTILEGPDAPDLSVRLFQVMQGIDPADPRGRKINWFGREMDETALREQMVRDARLIYEFEVQRAYGMY